MHQFVLHAALDAVEDQQWQSTNMNLGVVDKFNNLQVNAHCILYSPEALMDGPPLASTLLEDRREVLV